jgi:hypothetical protein
MIAVVPGRDIAGRWRLVSRTAAGADVLASASTDGEMPGREALRRLRAADGTVRVVPVRDAHFKWTLTDADGRVIAESPAVYRSPDACRQAFTDARRAARIALGGSPAADPPDSRRS